MKQTIIFFDIDGTIYSSEIGEIRKRVRESIAATQKKGHLCFVASGRPYSFIAENVKEIGFDGYILNNGGQIRYRNEDIAVYHMDYQALKDACKKLRKKKIEYVLLTESGAYLKKEYRRLLKYYSKFNIDFQNFIYDYEEEEVLHRTLKVELWAENKEEMDYALQCFAEFNYEIHPDGKSVEIYQKERTKASGIKNVLEYLNIPIEQSYCFGDGPNDVEMFSVVAHPIAMGNALDIIKEKAEDICPDITRDGVALKLEELFLKKESSDQSLD